MSETLFGKLLQYSRTDYYPFHMPGHKRYPGADCLPFEIDITEIEGFDNLHHPQGIIKQAQYRAANLYGSEETYFLVNGSTVGLLAGISAVVSTSGKIIMARNCHKAAYNAAFLKDLEVVYLYPGWKEDLGIYSKVSPLEVKRLLEENPDVQAVVITSPTYEGVVSDVQAIAELVHTYGIPLIVDEAHGAHFGFYPDKLSENAIRRGADIVIHSLHKTLPSLTQTALLHVNGKLVDKEKLRRYINIYQTSSPSYVMMAGIDYCMQLIKKQGSDLFKSYVNRLENFYEGMKKLKHLYLYKKDTDETGMIDADISKLIIFTTNTAITGKQLYDILLEKYHIQMEMATGHYVLGMTSIMDTQEGFDRLGHALSEIDQSMINGGKTDDREENLFFNFKKLEEAKIYMKAAHAEQAKKKKVPIESAIDSISSEYIYRYPPGIPLLVPGEMITEEIVRQIIEDKQKGLFFEGMDDELGDFIYVVDQPH